MNGSNEVEAGLEALLPRLWRFALTLTRDSNQAEDLVQDACERMLRKAHLFRAGSRLDRWAMTVLANVWTDRLRGGSSRDALGGEALSAVPDPRPGPEAMADAKSALAAIDRLPAAQRALVVLVYGDGFTYREASEIVGIPIGTVMSRLHAARHRLVAEIGPE